MTASVGRATMATLMKPNADFTISRFLDCRNTVIVATSSEIVDVEIESYKASAKLMLVERKEMNVIMWSGRNQTYP